MSDPLFVVGQEVYDVVAAAKVRILAVLAIDRCGSLLFVYEVSQSGMKGHWTEERFLARILTAEEARHHE